MRVFVTGATGFVGSAVVEELMTAGHVVLALARSDAAAARIRTAGALVHRGDLEDLDSLSRGAADVDAVIHTGFVHDFTRFQAVCEIDGRVIETLGAALQGSDRPLLVTAGVALIAPDGVATEADAGPLVTASYPRLSERAAASVATLGVRVCTVRLPPSVHGNGDHGFVPMLIDVARRTGEAAYVGDGTNQWAAVHRRDAARLYRRALEMAHPGARYHAVAEQGVAFHDIAEIIGRQLNLPVVSKSTDDAAAHFGWLAGFAAMNSPADSAHTRERLDWHPTQPGLLADLEHGTYFDS